MTYPRAWLSTNGNMTDIGTLGGYYSTPTGINASGQVVGFSATAAGSTHAFMWSDGVLTDLGVLGLDYSSANAINDVGQVAGEALTRSGVLRAVLWSGGVMTDLGSLGGDTSRAFAINNDGQVVGRSATATGTEHAFLWTNGVMTDLGTLGGGSSTAWGINDAGLVVGESMTALGVQHAFVWSGGVMTDLGSLGGNESTASSINNSGQVVGFSTTPSGAEHAFICETDVDHDGLLNSWEGAGNGIPIEGGGLYSLAGSSPNHKDIYLELDAMRGCAPAQAALDSLVAAFRRAPVDNPDHVKGVSLHIVGAGGNLNAPSLSDADISPEQWTITDFTDNTISFWYFDPVWRDYFGTAEEHGNYAVLHAKSKAFYYGLCADNALNPSHTSRYYGRAFDIPSNHFWTALGSGIRSWQTEAGCLMHELGHCLGLTHGGRTGDPSDVDAMYKPNYYSVMNYTWTKPAGEMLVNWPGPLDLRLWSQSWRLDYSHSTLNTLDECHLNEGLPNAIGGDPSVFVPVGLGDNSAECALGARSRAVRSMGGPIDWSPVMRDDPDAKADVTDIIPDRANEMQVLHGAEDWSQLQYVPAIPWAWRLYCPTLEPCFGVSPAVARSTATALGNAGSDSSFTQETFAALDTLGFDCNQNGIVDRLEVAANPTLDRNGNGIPDVCETGSASGVSDQPSPEVIPAGFQVSAAHPNPFTQTVALDVRIGTQPVELGFSVFDVAGRVVQVRPLGRLEPGTHRITWDGNAQGGSMAKSGVYYIRVASTNGDAVVRKVLLTK